MISPDRKQPNTPEQPPGLQTESATVPTRKSSSKTRAKKKSPQKSERPNSTRPKTTRPKTTRPSKALPVPASIRNNLIGDQYGRLKVINFAGYRDKAIMWECRCECGDISTYYRANLRSGTSSQCWQCGRNQFAKQSTKHGMNRTPEYRAWERVRRSEMCCRAWANFQTFYDDVGDKPSADHFLVRRNPKRNWSPSNAVWVLKTEMNKVNGKAQMVRYKGQTKSLAEWADEIGITRQSLRGRLQRGWTMKQAMEQPPRKKAKKKKAKKKSARKKVTKKKAVSRASQRKVTKKKKTTRKKSVKKATTRRSVKKSPATKKAASKKAAVKKKSARKKIAKRKTTGRKSR